MKKPASLPVARPPGPLSEAIPGAWNTLFFSREDHAQRILDIRREKLRLLAKHFGVPDGPPEVTWFWLAYRLAEAHEPGFQILDTPPLVPKRGRPQGSDDFEIYVAIERLRAEARQSASGTDLPVDEACRRMHKISFTNREGSRLRRRSPRSIERGYYAAKKLYEAVPLDRVFEIHDRIHRLDGVNKPLRKSRKK